MSWLAPSGMISWPGNRHRPGRTGLRLPTAYRAAHAMLTREGARLQVFLELRRRYGLRSGPEELVILDEQIIELPGGWIFLYTTRGFRSREMKYAVGGNTPIYIERESRLMRSWSG